MSDSTQQYMLKRQPKIEMTDERIYFKLPWGEWWTSRKEHESDFVDIPAIQKQLEGHLASFIVNVTEYVDLCDHAQNAEELNAIRGHFNRCQHEHIAQVLRLFGLEQGSDK